MTRLHEICSSSEINGSETKVTITKDDFIWLIEQVEKVKQLETEIHEAKGKNNALITENENLSEEFEQLQDTYTKLANKIKSVPLKNSQTEK